MTGHADNARYGEPLASWPAKLAEFKAGYNLADLTLYCDHHCYFTWRGGRQFALDVKKNCPHGKTPALLLTNRENVEHLQFQSEREHITVVMMKVVGSSGSALSAYLAKAVGVRPADFEDIKLNRLIKVGDIRDWVGNDIARLLDLVRLIGQQAGLSQVEGGEYSTEDFEAVLRELVAAGPGWLGSMSRIVSENLRPRIVRVQQEADEFESLLKEEDCGEDECQAWLEEHPWILGLEYARVRPRQSATRGKMDFLLERYDGFHDLLELKSPQDDIVVEKSSNNESVPPPSHYSLSPAVANALAQAHSYRLRLTRDEAAMLHEHNLEKTRHPRVIIIVGRDARLTGHGRDVLAEINRSLHRVEIIPYDKVVARARMLVKNVEAYLFTREREPEAVSGPSHDTGPS